MRTYKQVLKQVPDNIFCDVCGMNCTYHPWGTECGFLDASWGYNSQKDESKYDIHLCEKCFDNTIDFLRQMRSQYPSVISNIQHNKDPFDGIS